ncbi:MAG: transporter substrate-binding domain-containing protein [Nodosilinea sp.]
MRRRCFILGGPLVGGLLTVWLTTWPAFAQFSPGNSVVSPSPATAEPIRVATRLIQPDAFEKNGEIVGFSVDVGRAILAEMEQPAALQTYSDVSAILEAIRTEQADLGIASIAVTSQREQEFDFSHPILLGGLQILVPMPVEQTRVAEEEIVRRLLQPDLLRLTGVVALLMLIPAHVLWYFERNNKDGLIDNSAYFPGIFHALWWTILTLLGQADEMPRGPVGKIVGLFWLVVGVIYLTYFTAGLTAELAVQEIQGNIHSLADLQNRPVALLADDEAIDYLVANNVQQITRFTQPESAFAALAAHEVEAVIAPRPLLLYYAAHEGRDLVEVVGTPFREQYFAIVMAKDSPYRKPVNKAILTLKENGTYETIHQKWFGISPQD